MLRTKQFGSSLHNTSKKRQAEMASGAWKPKPRKPLRQASKKASSLWAKARRECLERYEHRCFICGSTGEIHVHHIILRSLAPELKYESDNLVCLCGKCHSHNGYDEKYIILTQKLIDNGLGTKYNLHIHNKRVLYERNLETV